MWSSVAGPLEDAEEGTPVHPRRHTCPLPGRLPDLPISLLVCWGLRVWSSAELAVKQESSDFKTCPEGMNSHGAGRGIGGGDLLSQASRGSGLTERSTTNPGRRLHLSGESKSCTS